MKKLKIFLLTLLMVITLLPVNTIAEGDTLEPDNPDDSLFVAGTPGEDGIYFSSAATGSTGIINSNASLISRREVEPEQLDLCVYPIDGFIKILHIYTTTDKTTLIVQGKNGDYNWSFSKTFTEIVEDEDNVTIKKSEIIEELMKIEELKNIKDIDLSKCKIWLEKGQGNTIGAVLAKTNYTTIDSVAIDIATPVVNEKPASSATHNITSNTNIDIKWSPDVNNDKFGYYTEYTVSVTLSLAYDDPYVFAASPTATVNGKSANVTRNIGYNSITVSYEFDPTAKDEFVKAYDPDPITVENGTSLEDIKDLIPETVKVDTKGQKDIDKPVFWNPYAVIYTSYDPTKKDSQSFTIDGGVNLGDSISYSNDGPPQVKLSIFVKAAEVVPPATPEPTSTPAPTVVTTTTDDGYVVPNTGVK